VIVKLQVTWEVSSQYLSVFEFDPHTHTLLPKTLNLWANGSQICQGTHTQRTQQKTAIRSHP
jgi:hypothetical protein